MRLADMGWTHYTATAEEYAEEEWRRLLALAGLEGRGQMFDRVADLTDGTRSVEQLTSNVRELAEAVELLALSVGRLVERVGQMKRGAAR